MTAKTFNSPHLYNIANPSPLLGRADMFHRLVGKKPVLLPGGVAPRKGSALTVGALFWRCRFLIAASVFLVFLGRYVAEEASRGVGGTSAANILAQCIFKSYAHVEGVSRKSG